MAEGFFLANRPEHQLALKVLATLDLEFLRDAECWFAGGTAISLRCDEFRVSRDIDFLCSSREGYRLLRERTHDRGACGLFAQDITLGRDIRADRYGVRFAVNVKGTILKIEIVREGNIDLEGVEDQSLPVARLSDQDLVATKLLANHDRFLEEGANFRDIIDLIMLEHQLGELPATAWSKARQAYGDSIENAFYRALQRLRDDPAMRRRAFGALSITPVAQTIIQNKLAKIP
jgi:hypothetical protein